MLSIARPAVVNHFQDAFGVQYRSVDDFLASQAHTVAGQIGSLSLTLLFPSIQSNHGILEPHSYATLELLKNHMIA